MNKKIIFVLTVIFLLLPITVLALGNDSVFDIGDSVSVSFNGNTDSANLIGFHVLKGSKSGESTVTLIYDGVMSTHDADGTMHAQVPFQSANTTSNNYSQFAGSYVKTFLEQSVKENNWILASSARLLEESDLMFLGIEKESDGTFTIPTKYDFLRPVEFETTISASTTDYWTQIVSGDDGVYVVTKEGKDTANNISAKIVSKSVAPTADNAYSVKPVVVVDKQYIVCNNSKQTENVKTGIEDYFILFGGIILLATIGYVVSKKKDAFQNI